MGVILFLRIVEVENVFYPELYREGRSSDEYYMATKAPFSFKTRQTDKLDIIMALLDEQRARVRQLFERDGVNHEKSLKQFHKEYPRVSAIAFCDYWRKSFLCDNTERYE